MAQRPSQRHKNARARIFFLAFSLACALSLTYTFIRPAVYVSTASLVITPADQQRLSPLVQAQSPQQSAVDVLPDDDGGTAGTSPFLQTEIQRLTSQTIISGIIDRLQKQGGRSESPDRLLAMLHATVVPGTHILQLRAQGPRPEELPPILNAWIATYLDAWNQSHQHSSSDSLQRLQEKVKRLHHKMEDKRQALDAFRAKYGILSMDSDGNGSLASDSNDAIAKVKALTKALNDARTSEAQTESNLQAMKDAVARGQTVVLPEDKRELATLESRAMDIRNQLTTLRDKFTPLYISKDPDYRNLQPTLDRLEKKIREERRASQQEALNQAQQAAESARDTVSRLKQKLRQSKESAMEFTTRFTQHKELVGELNQLEGLYNAAHDRLADMQATSEKSRVPQVSVLNKPTLPDAPAYPNYSRDAAISTGGSAVFALLAVFFVEFLNRSGQRPAPPSAMQPRIQIANFPSFPDHRAHDDGKDDVQEPHLLSSSATLPRELTTPEILALMDAARDDGLLVVVALLSGLTLDELAATTWDDIDLDGGVIHLPGSRIYSLHDPLKGMLAARPAMQTGSPYLLADHTGNPMHVSDLEGLIACTAHDAGIGAPADVTSAVLRHTYVAFLVRQGVRMSELNRVVGRIPPALFSAYGRLSPPGPGLAVDQIELIPPALADYARRHTPALGRDGPR